MENIEISKATDIDKLPGRFLKDCNLSISHGIFLDALKVTHLITGLSPYCQRFKKSLKGTSQSDI